MACPCETRTSTCRSFATISSGLYRFLAITVLLDVKRHTSSRTTSMGADQTGDDVPYKNNTVVVDCYRDRRECLTYSIEQIAPNQVGRLHGAIIFPITAWNAFEVIATEDASVLDCRKTTITLERKRQSAVWVEEPINQARAACKNSTTKIYKWTIEDPPAWKAMRK